MTKWLRVCGLAVIGALLAASSLRSQTPAGVPVADQFDRLHFRSIGPAVMSGRVSDFAVYEAKPSIYYVAAAHSGVWKTTNNGVTFTAEFQDQGLMSIGDVTVSQRDPDLVWVGTGEGNNRQRSVVGRRRVQVHRRRQDVEEHGSSQLLQHQSHRHRPCRQQHRLRGRAGEACLVQAAIAACIARLTVARRGSAFRC